jgi:hypothetical protein
MARNFLIANGRKGSKRPVIYDLLVDGDTVLEGESYTDIYDYIHDQGEDEDWITEQSLPKWKGRSVKDLKQKWEE